LAERKGKEVEMEGKNVFAPLFQLLLPVTVSVTVTITFPPSRSRQKSLDQIVKIPQIVKEVVAVLAMAATPPTRMPMTF